MCMCYDGTTTRKFAHMKRNDGIIHVYITTASGLLTSTRRQLLNLKLPLISVISLSQGLINVGTIRQVSMH